MNSELLLKIYGSRCEFAVFGINSYLKVNSEFSANSNVKLRIYTEKCVFTFYSTNIYFEVWIHSYQQKLTQIISVNSRF